MGHLVVMDDSEAQFALTSYSCALWRKLLPELPRDVDYDPCGTLWVAADETEMAQVRRKHHRYAEAGLRVETLDATALRTIEPSLRPNLVGALRVVDDAVIYPPCAARFLLERAVRHGAQLRVGQAVTEWLPQGGVRLSDGSQLAAGQCLNATGHWAPTLSPSAKVRPRKGHLLITDRHPGFVHHQIVELGYLKSAHQVSQDSVAFNIQPRKNGQMLIGSSRQFDALDTAVEQPML